MRFEGSGKRIGATLDPLATASGGSGRAAGLSPGSLMGLGGVNARMIGRSICSPGSPTVCGESTYALTFETTGTWLAGRGPFAATIGAGGGGAAAISGNSANVDSLVVAPERSTNSSRNTTRSVVDR